MGCERHGVEVEEKWSRTAPIARPLPRLWRGVARLETFPRPAERLLHRQSTDTVNGMACPRDDSNEYPVGAHRSLK